MDLRLQNQNLEKMLAFFLAFLAVIACVLYFQDRRRQKMTAQEKAYGRLRQRFENGLAGDSTALRGDMRKVYKDIRTSYEKAIKENGLSA